MHGESSALSANVQVAPLQRQVMSAATFADLNYGVEASATAKRKQNQAVLDRLALHLAVLDWPQEAVQHHAEIRLDLMIASHARAVGAIAVTNNTQDFGRVKGLQVENWTKQETMKEQAMTQFATITGYVTYMPGDGVPIEIPQGRVEVDLASESATLSWEAAQGVRGVAAIPRTTFEEYVQGGEILLESGHESGRSN